MESKEEAGGMEKGQIRVVFCAIQGCEAMFGEEGHELRVTDILCMSRNVFAPHGLLGV